MDVVGSEIGQKMRSAIKAKLTELGCYVDDELPDYVMVMVANKRTRLQMEDDLQLFLGDNTELFVNWLHQVLKKLQEVTVTAPLKADLDKAKDKSKEIGKSKEKKDKSKKNDSGKKSKKKEKAKKKEEKKSHKKKKSKHHEMIRPNVAPFLMNIEKEPEPSITDVFAGQILKNHGVMLEPYKEDTTKTDVKTIVEEVKKPIIPIIDPATITSQTEILVEQDVDDTSNTNNDKQDQMTEMNQIEAKIQGLKQKLAEQLDSMSDDEDFLTIRTEAEELMNDFAEDVFQEIAQPPPITPPLKSPTKIQTPTLTLDQPVPTPPQIEPETLPQIELNLPKRPIRERLGAREVPKVVEKEREPAKAIESPERLTPEREPEFRPQAKSTKSRLGSQSESQRRVSVSEDSSEKPQPAKRLTSKVSCMEKRPRGTCTSVVRVRPRPRVATTSSLLLRAVADAHKSLLNIPPKVETELPKIKRALVLPMRRCVDPKKIVIQVPVDLQTSQDSQGDSVSLGGNESDFEDKSSKTTSDDKGEYTPRPITKVIKNTEYLSNKNEKLQDDHEIIDNITIHATSDKSKDTQFIVTMDGYHPNAFLAKKLMTEGILDEEIKEPKEKRMSIEKNEQITPVDDKEKREPKTVPQKRLSDTSEDSATQVIIKKDTAEKRKSIELEVKVDNIEKSEEVEKKNESPPPVKKRKGSPIVFDVKKDGKEEVRQRTTSGSDSQVTVTTVSSTNKYDSLPSLPNTTQADRKLWCRSFPACRFGSACAFTHPRCKFAASCTRRGCPYSHVSTPAGPARLMASHVVPVANYKSISAVAVPSVCKFYPNCVNAACHYYHPKPCRYGKACTNKLECNFYHNDVPSKWKYPN